MINVFLKSALNIFLDIPKTLNTFEIDLSTRVLD